MIVGSGSSPTHGSGGTVVPDLAATNGTSATPHDEPESTTRRPVRRRLSQRQAQQLACLAVLVVLLSAALGFGLGNLLTPQYAARADVLYLLTREQPTGFLREDRNLTTQLVLLTSRSVLEPVATEWAMPVEDLIKKIEPTVLEQSEVVRIQLVDSDAERAQKMLDAVVRSYLESSNNDERDAVRTYLDGQLREVLGRIEEVRTVGSTRHAEIAPLVDREQELRSQLDDLRVTDLAGPGARVLVPAYVESEPISMSPLLTSASGALLGVVVAALAVAVVARRMTGS